MLRLTANKSSRSPLLHKYQFIDRYGHYRDLPMDAKVKTRLGIFGITISRGGKLLVTYPPHALNMPGLPGGGCEGIETHAQTLQREYFEEVSRYFVIKNKKGAIYQQRILYYASDADEYWQYDQVFYIANVHLLKVPTSRWITPEGGRAKWISLQDYHFITAAHQPAIGYYLKRK